MAELSEVQVDTVIGSGLPCYVVSADGWGVTITTEYWFEGDSIVTTDLSDGRSFRRPRSVTEVRRCRSREQAIDAVDWSALNVTIQDLQRWADEHADARR
jgi:hypothetical protein